MNKIGLFYSSSTGNCETIAQLIKTSFSPFIVETFDVLKCDHNCLGKYNLLIFGIPTWSKDGLHEDWEDFFTKLPVDILHRKKIALYGLGDQVAYSNSFANSLGHMHNKIARENIELIGQWSNTGYNFKSSKALIGKDFVGLVLDEDTQSKFTKFRVRTWVDQLKAELNLN